MRTMSSSRSFRDLITRSTFFSNETLPTVITILLPSRPYLLRTASPASGLLVKRALSMPVGTTSILFGFTPMVSVTSLPALGVGTRMAAGLFIICLR